MGTSLKAPPRARAALPLLLAALLPLSCRKSEPAGAETSAPLSAPAIPGHGEGGVPASEDAAPEEDAIAATAEMLRERERRQAEIDAHVAAAETEWKAALETAVKRDPGIETLTGDYSSGLFHIPHHMNSFLWKLNRWRENERFDGDTRRSDLARALRQRAFVKHAAELLSGSSALKTVTGRDLKPLFREMIALSAASAAGPEEEADWRNPLSSTAIPPEVMKEIQRDPAAQVTVYGQRVEGLMTDRESLALPLLEDWQEKSAGAALAFFTVSQLLEARLTPEEAEVKHRLEAAWRERREEFNRVMP